MTEVTRVGRRYAPEFRAQAVKLVLDEKMTIVQAAQNLGVAPSTLDGWVRKFRSGQWNSNSTGKIHTVVSPDKLRVQELERQVRRLTLEREILKKAMAYCVEVPK